MPQDDRTHRASRHIAAAPSAVFQAFTDPELWTKWLPPQGMTGRIDHFYLRPGGTYRMALVYAEPDPAAKSKDNSDIVEGTFTAVEPGRLLSQTVVFEADDPAFAGEMTMTWLVEAASGGSLVTMVAENVAAGISEADHAAGMGSSLDNLARLLEA